MTITSMFGQGTVVSIVLPPAMGEPDAPIAPVHQSPDGIETLMVVDDDEPVRRVTAATLRRRGVNVFEAASGADALRIAGNRKTPMNLLVTDVVMLGMTGPELAKLYLSEQLSTQVLFLSGYPEDTITEYGYVPDGVELLSKPCDIQEPRPSAGSTL